MQSFEAIENRYWAISYHLQIDQYINPTNIEEEKQRFFESFRQKKRYDPQFSYKNLPNNIDDLLDEMRQVRQHFKWCEHPLSTSYILLADGLIQAFEAFKNRYESPKVLYHWITNLYGEPPLKLRQEALHILENLHTSTQNREIDANEAAQFIGKELEEKGFREWKVFVRPIPARMSVNQAEQIVTVSQHAKFSEIELVRLKVHEIDTHVLRSENGKRQPYAIFRYGFPSYLKTEEGLAILSEEKAGVLSDNDKKRYALRVVACYEAMEKGFYDLFDTLLHHTDMDEAFSMTLRIKRGIVHTSVAGGYTKDQVYLDGYLTLKKEPLSTIRKLYYGKIGLEHLHTIDMLQDLHHTLRYPSWIDNNDDRSILST